MQGATAFLTKEKSTHTGLYTSLYRSGKLLYYTFVNIPQVVRGDAVGSNTELQAGMSRRHWDY